MWAVIRRCSLAIWETSWSDVLGCTNCLPGACLKTWLNSIQDKAYDPVKDIPGEIGSFLLTLSHHNRISHAFKQLPHHSVSVDSPWQQVVLMWDHEVSEKTLRQETKAHSFLLLPLGYFSLESHSKAIFTFTPGLEYSLLSEILLCYIILNWFYCIRHAVWNVTWLMRFMPHTNLHTQAKSHAT